MAHKLLLADDSVTIQRVIELTFADEDVEVTTVGDGQLAIDRLDIRSARHRPGGRRHAEARRLRGRRVREEPPEARPHSRGPADGRIRADRSGPRHGGRVERRARETLRASNGDQSSERASRQEAAGTRERGRDAGAAEASAAGAAALADRAPDSAPPGRAASRSESGRRQLRRPTQPTPACRARHGRTDSARSPCRSTTTSISSTRRSRTFSPVRPPAMRRRRNAIGRFRARAPAASCTAQRRRRLHRCVQAPRRRSPQSRLAVRLRACVAPIASACRRSASAKRYGGQDGGQVRGHAVDARAAPACECGRRHRRRPRHLSRRHSATAGIAVGTGNNVVGVPASHRRCQRSCRRSSHPPPRRLRPTLRRTSPSHSAHLSRLSHPSHLSHQSRGAPSAGACNGARAESRVRADGNAIAQSAAVEPDKPDAPVAAVASASTGRPRREAGSGTARVGRADPDCARSTCRADCRSHRRRTSGRRVCTERPRPIRLRIFRRRKPKPRRVPPRPSITDEVIEEIVSRVLRGSPTRSCAKPSPKSCRRRPSAWSRKRSIGSRSQGLGS